MTAIVTLPDSQRMVRTRLGSDESTPRSDRRPMGAAVVRHDRIAAGYANYRSSGLAARTVTE